MVVPILAPKIMEIACGRVIRPALTNPIAITVVAEELCRTAVTRAPDKTPITGFLVRTPSTVFIFSPAAFCRLSLIMFIPKRKMASPPSRPKTICTFSFIQSTSVVGLTIQSFQPIVPGVKEAGYQRYVYGMLILCQRHCIFRPGLRGRNAAPFAETKKDCRMISGSL